MKEKMSFARGVYLARESHANFLRAIRPESSKKEYRKAIALSVSQEKRASWHIGLSSAYWPEWIVDFN